MRKISVSDVEFINITINSDNFKQLSDGSKALYLSLHLLDKKEVFFTADELVDETKRLGYSIFNLVELENAGYVAKRVDGNYAVYAADVKGD